MENIFLSLQERIATAIKEINNRVDEDYGQLDTDEDTYPIVFPCVLIETLQTNWSNMAANTYKSQIGNCAITVKLAIDCYDDTYYNSTSKDRMIDRQHIAADLHKCLQGYTPTGARTPLTRVVSRNYTIRGGIKVYEINYNLTIIDSDE